MHLSLRIGDAKQGRREKNGMDHFLFGDQKLIIS